MTHPNIGKFIDSIEGFIANIDGELAAKRAFTDKVLGLAPSVADYQYQLDPQLLGQMAQLDLLEDIQELLRQLSNKQPTLELTVSPNVKEARFIYRSRHVEFMGRDAELDALDKFISSDGLFSWCLVSGPGGMGKSRLALEFLIKKAGAFAAGFISRDNVQKIDWDEWQPVRPTLMVIDYAALDAESVAKITAKLSNRHANGALDFKVRLLLLERDANGHWLETVKCTSSSNKGLVRDTYYSFSEEPVGNLLLQQIDIGTLWTFMLQIIGEYDVDIPDLKETVTKLAEIDPQLRPLYAAFLADAIGRGVDVRQWDRRQLLDDVLSYERKHYWEPKGVDEKVENLLALITASGELTQEQVKQICNADKDRYLPDWDAVALPKAMVAVFGSQNKGEFVPIEPDILGEVFVLGQLESLPAFTPILAAKAWNENLFFYAAFLNRLSDDFVESFDPELISPIFSASDPLPALVAAVVGVNLVNRLGEVPKFRQTAIDIYEELKRLTLEQDNQEIWLQQARAAVNLTSDLGKLPEFRQKAMDIYEELKILALEQDNQEIWVAQAQAAFNLTSDLGKLPEFRQKAVDIYEELKTLALEQDNQEIWVAQAQAAVNLVGRLGEVPEFRQKAVDIYEELKILALEQDNQEIWIEQAKAAVNLVGLLGEVPEFRQNALNIYEELKILAQEQDNQEIWLRQARAAFNLTSGLGEVPEFRQKAADIYEELKILALEQDNQEIWPLQAQAAFNLISDLGKLPEFRQKAMDIYEEMKILAQEQDNQEIWLRQAQAAFNLSSKLGEVPEFRQKAADIYEELKTLAREQDNQEIWPLRAQAAFNLISKLGKLPEFRQKAVDIYEELKILALEQDNQEIWIAQVKGSVAMLKSALTCQRALEMNYFQDCLNAAANCRPEEMGQVLVITTALHLRACELESQEKFDNDLAQISEIEALYEAALPLLEQMRQEKIGE